jgi:hypothetical protein
MSLREFGASGDASNIVVTCNTCNAERRMADAFDPDTPFSCPGHHPHLLLVEHKCKEPAKTILLGASNAWFPTALSALSIPRACPKPLADIFNKLSKACASVLPILFVPNTAQTSMVVVSRELAATPASFRRRHRVSGATGI